MDSLLYPQWQAASDEVGASDSASFSACDDVVNEIAAKGDNKITERWYSISWRWGKIVRASATTMYAGRPSKTFITCWSANDSDVEFAITGETYGS